MYESLKVEVTEMDYQTFLDISVHLTGFNKNELLATGMPETYYYTIMKETDQDNVRAFFKQAKDLIDKYGSGDNELNKQISQHLLPVENFLELGRRIILLWYTGIWTSIVITNGKPISSSNMISSASYSEGLIWVAAETHPAGAKQPGYASWGLPPL
jgi:hypothetical protein